MISKHHCSYCFTLFATEASTLPQTLFQVIFISKLTHYAAPFETIHSNYL